MIKRKFVTTIFSLLILVGCIFRYFYINADTPKKYKIDTYSIKDTINLDSVSLVINKFSLNKREEQSDGDNNYEVILDISVKNTSKSILSLEDLISFSKLSYGVYFQDYCNPEGQLKKIGNLLPEDKIDLKLVYTIYLRDLKKIEQDNKYKFYIAKSLFSRQILEEFDNGYLYGKCVNLEKEQRCEN